MTPKGFSFKEIVDAMNADDLDGGSRLAEMSRESLSAANLPQIPQQGYGADVPAPTPATMSADEVNAEVKRLCREFFAEAQPGQQCLIEATLGTGKSHAVREAIKEAVDADPNYRVLIRVPMHRLADEFAQELEAAGVSCGVWRGIDQPDPSDPDLRMCRRVEDANAALNSGVGVSDICGSSAESGCPFFNVCGWRQQNLTSVNVVIVAGDISISKPLPARTKRSVKLGAETDKQRRQRIAEGRTLDDVRPNFDAVILDETDPLGLVSGADQRHGGIRISDLQADLIGMAKDLGHEIKDPDESSERCMPVALVGQTLTALHEAMMIVAPEVAGSEEGILTPALIAYKVNDNGNDNDLEGAMRTLIRARGTLWKLRPANVVEGLPEMKADEIREALADHSTLVGMLNRIGRLLRALIQALEDAVRNGVRGAAEIATVRVRRVRSREVAGETRVVASVMYRTQITSDVMDSRILLLDATPQVSLLRGWFPKLQVVGQLRARDGDGVTRVQFADHVMSYSKIAPTPNSRHFNVQAQNTQRAATAVAALGAMYGKQASLIMPQRSEDYIEARRPDLAEKVMIGHFGGVRGSNAFKDSRVLATAGRQSLGVRDVERLATVIGGKPLIEIVPAQENGMELMPRRRCTLLMRDDGVPVQVENEYHPDPMAEACRRAVTEGELDQSQGRGRAVRRGVDRPLLDIRLSSVVSDTPVDVVWSEGHLEALGDFAGLLLIDGVWPMGRGSVRATQVTLRRLVAGLDDKAQAQLGFLTTKLVTAEDDLAEGFYRVKQTRPALVGLIEAMDKAITEGASEVKLCGVTVPLGDWVMVKVAVPGSQLTTNCDAAIRADSPSEAISRARAAFPGCEVSLPRSGLSAGEQRIESAIGKHRCLPLGYKVASRHMPEVWPNEKAAARDLSLKSGGTRFASYPPLPIRDSIYGQRGTRPDFCPPTFFAAESDLKPARSEVNRQPKKIEVAVFGPVAEVREILSPLFGEVSDLTLVNVLDGTEANLDVKITFADLIELQREDITTPLPTPAIVERVATAIQNIAEVLAKAASRLNLAGSEPTPTQ
ncbi:MAG: hypothetical protein ACE368_22545 [Paracoccaceae bacterium]